MKKKLKRLAKSFHYASKGIHHTLKTQQNMWIHFAVGIIIFLFALYLGFNYLELAILLLTIALVLTLEMLNTVAETIIDLTSPDFSELGRIVKDVAAGAVLIAAFFSIIIGFLLFAPKLL